jgi:hypothetical protein
VEDGSSAGRIDLRFDDTIATVLAQPARGAADAVARWRQLVDLLAQRRAPGAAPAAENAFSWLEAHRSDVGLLVRQQAAQTLAWRRIDPRLLAFFAEDHPSVAQPLISTCRLDAEEWIALLPRLNPTARGLLRHRRDLPGEVEQALAAFGKSDFALGSPEAAGERSPGAEKGEAQIRELVARIEAYRRQKEAASTEPPEFSEAEAEPADGFRWECGADGIILWVEGAPRGPLVGQSIASIAERGQFGVDGQAAGAFEKRSPFRDARFSVPGEGAAAGDWRISGVPFFEPNRGHFLGYRGSARRPRLDEVARSAAERDGDGLFGTRLPADSLRQLIHELRTPLNAIVGFAEMIDGQYMGACGRPVPHPRSRHRRTGPPAPHRGRRPRHGGADRDQPARARRKLGRCGRSCSAVSTTATSASPASAAHRSRSRSRATCRRRASRAPRPSACSRGCSRPRSASPARGRRSPPRCARRAGAGRADALPSIDRPRAIAASTSGRCSIPGYSPDGDWPGAPALGLGFSLRLVRNLAEAVGGALVVGERAFSLYLPPHEPAERTRARAAKAKGERGSVRHRAKGAGTRAARPAAAARRLSRSARKVSAGASRSSSTPRRSSTGRSRRPATSTAPAPPSRSRRSTAGCARRASSPLT